MGGAAARSRPLQEAVPSLPLRGFRLTQVSFPCDIRQQPSGNRLWRPVEVQALIHQAPGGPGRDWCVVAAHQFRQFRQSGLAAIQQLAGRFRLCRADRRGRDLAQATHRAGMQQYDILGANSQCPAILQFNFQFIAKRDHPGRTILVQRQAVLRDIHQTSKRASKPVGRQGAEMAQSIAKVISDSALRSQRPGCVVVPASRPTGTSPPCGLAPSSGSGIRTG